MKKIFVMLAFAVMTMFSGVLLSACDLSSYEIHLTISEQNLVYAKVEANSQELQPFESGKYRANSLDEVRILFYATQNGVLLKNGDEPAIDVMVNGEKQQVLPFNVVGSNDKSFGYINLTRQSKNVEVVVSGAQSVHSSFEFKAVDGGSETAQKRMQSAEIKLPGENEFVNFAEFMASEDKTFGQDFLGKENFETTFQLRFVNPEFVNSEDEESKVSGNPYRITRQTPFVIKENAQDLQFSELSSTSYSGGVYTFNLGECQTGKTYTIEVDFDKLECTQFGINLTDNNTYSTVLGSGEEFLTYETATTIKVTKKMSEVGMDKTDVKAMLNNFELSLDAEAQDGPDEMTFVIPQGLTPWLVGGEDDEFVFLLKGLDYGEQKTHIVSAETNEGHLLHLVNPEIYVLDEEGNDDGEVGFDGDGNQITFEGKTNVLAWKYEPYNLGTENGKTVYTYRTPYDLSDYDVMLNGELLFNIKTVLDEEKAKPGFVAGQEIVHEENGYVLKATQSIKDTETTYATNTYDTFTLQFEATQDMEFTFDNFKLFKKEVNIGYDFEDEDVETVECFVGTTNTDLDNVTWEAIPEGQRLEGRFVEYGNVIYFRLQVKRKMRPGEFSIDSKTEGNSWLPQDEMTIGDDEFVILKFTTTTLHWDGPQDVTLVKN